MTKIYLEMKPVYQGGVNTGYFHLYIVSRPDPGPGDTDSLAWRSSGLVLRGGTSNPLGGPITVQTGALAQSGDAYTSQADLSERRIFDITDAVGGDAGWNSMAATLAAIAAAGFRYELPVNRTDDMDHVANSNATALTLLNSVGVDVRSLIGSDSNIPGAGVNATLLAIGSDPTAASAGVQQPITFLGRDNVSDTFLGRAVGDRFFGEQNNNGNAVDTVNYGGVDQALQMTLDGTAQRQSQVIVQSKNGSDQLVGIEKIILSQYNDTVVVSHTLPQGIQEVDGGGTDSGGKDTLDLRGADNKLTFDGDHVVGSSTIFKGFEILKVDPGNDTVILEDQDAQSFQEVDFGDGNDTIESSVSNLKINLGDGQDIVKATGPGTVVKASTAAAAVGTIEISHDGQLLVENASTNDHLTYYGNTLTGGVRWGGSESIYAYGVYGERYGRNGLGDLVILDANGNETFVQRFNFGTSGTSLTAGLYVIEVTYTLARSNMWTASFETAASMLSADEKINEALYGKKSGPSDPLVLDLNGDGIPLSAQEASGVSFDIDNDGFAEPVGWVDENDGILVRDLNGNGKIDNDNEMFGGPSTSGFAQLATLDGNHDGKVDSSDNGLVDFNGDGVIDSSDTFDTLKVWVDANQNGLTDPGELKSLSDFNIVSISTGSTPSDATDSGNAIASTGSFQRADGTMGLVGDVDLDTDNFNTKWLGDSSVSAAAATRPDLKGFGTLTDMHVAMTLDPGLIAVVDSALPSLNTLSLANLRDAVRPILYAWAAAIPVPAGTPGTESTDDFNFVGTTNQQGGIVYDFLIEKTDSQGTYFAYASGQAVYDANHNVIDRPTEAQALASTPALGTWNTLSAADIDFLERYTGSSIGFGLSTNPSGDAISAVADALTAAWNELNKLAVRLAAQGPLSSFFAGISYDATSDLFRPTTDQQLAPMLETIFRATPTDPAEAEDYLKQWKAVIGMMLPDFHRDDNGLQVTDAYLFANIVGAYEDIPLSISLQDVAASLFDIPASELFTGAGTLVGGDATNDIFYLDSSDQVLQGQGGEDAYVVGYNFGHDVIQDEWQGLGNNQEDSIWFAHLNVADLTFTRDGIDLLITQNNTDNQIRVLNEFEGRRAGLFSAYQDFDESVEIIKFADGTTWDQTDIRNAVGLTLQPTDGKVIGTGDIDYLYAGHGATYMSGGSLGDQYFYGLGDGHVTIEDNESWILGQNDDFVNFGPGISQSDITFQRNGDSDDLEIAITGTDDVLTVAGQFAVAYGLYNTTVDRIEYFTFADGSYVGWEDIIKSMDASAGTDGNDTIYGFDYDDVLDGGKGDDYLSGGNGDDTYIFGRGYGADTIEDKLGYILSSDNKDTVQFKPDVAPSDISFHRNGDSDDLQITINGTNDSLTILGQFQVNYGLISTMDDRIELFTFADGTVIGWEDIIKQLDASAGTDGNDTIYGFSYADTLSGGKGDDVLAGGRDDDTYIYSRGDGHDTIIEVADAQAPAVDTLVLHGIDVSSVGLVRDGNDVTLVFADSEPGAGDAGSVLLKDELDDWFAQGVENIAFDDGTVWHQSDLRVMLLAQASTSGNDTIIGYNTNDIITGGLGDDTLEGGAGDDTYVYTRGDGNDTIIEVAGGNYSTVDTLVLHGLAPAAVSLVRNGDDDVTLVFAESAPGAGDGGSILLQSELDDWFSQGVENIAFDDGTVWHQSDLRVMLLAQESTSGNDTIVGFNTNDVITGGPGDDTLEGGAGDDTYIYSRGDGNDTIIEVAGGNFSTIDTLVLHGVDPVDVSLVRNGNDVTLMIAESTPGAGDAGSVLLKDEVDDFFSQGVENINFDDGTVWTQAELRNRLISSSGTPGNDVIDGTTSDDIIVGGKGDDILSGGAGDDTYIYARGDGNDTIIEGTSGNFTTIDTLILQGISPADVSLVRTDDAENDVTLVFAESTSGAGDGGSILLKNELDDFFSQGVERIAFDDGTIWTQADLRARLLIQATASTDGSIIGFNVADTIVAGLGDRYLEGRGGGDTYIYTSAGGNDVVDDGGPATLVMQDIASTGVTLSRPNGGSSLVLTVTSTGKTVTITNELGQWNGGGVTINFSDGVTWNEPQIQQMLLDTESAANGGSVYGYGGRNDTIVAGPGDKYLNGEGGNDTYIYTSAGGNDVVDDGGPSTLVMQDIASTGVTLSRPDGGSSLVLTDTATGKTVTITNEFGQWNNGGVTVDFGDGVSWNETQLRQKVLDQESAANGGSVYGYGGINDTIVAGLGDKYLNGEGGNDTYIYTSAGGNDVVDDGGPSTLVMQDIASTDVSVSRPDGGNSLVLRDIATAKTVTITNEFGQWNNGGVTVSFSDGVSWNESQFLDILTGGSDGDAGYLFGYGYGQVTVDSGTHAIRLGAGISASDVYFQTSGSGNLLIRLRGSDDMLTMNNDLLRQSWGVASAITELRFADGSTLPVGQPSAGQGASLTFTWFGTSNNYNLGGSNLGTNVFDITSGNGQITFGNASGGGSGRNTVQFDEGDGFGDINLNGGTGAIAFGADITAQDVYLQADGYGNLTVRILGDAADYITINNDLTDNAGTVTSGLDQLQFSDGTVVNLEQNPLTFTWFGSSNNYSLGYSTYGANLFKIAAGATHGTINFGNTSHGGNGENTIDYALGDGNVSVNLDGGTGAIVFGAGITAQDVYWQADGYGNLTVRVFGNSADYITINNDLTDNAGTVTSGLDQLQFSDGTVINLEQNPLTFTWFGSSNNYSLGYSNYGANLFEIAAGANNGSITFGNTNSGGNGQNTIDYAEGDGSLSVSLNGGTGTLDMGSDLTASDVYLQSNGYGDLIVNIVGDSSDSIIIHNDLTDSNGSVGSGLQQIQFSDGSEINLGQGSSPTFTWLGAPNSSFSGSNYGANVFELGQGSESATGGNTSNGGNGNNTYIASSNTGQATINANAAAGSTNELDFVGGITNDNLWFERSGNNLQIDLLGTNTQVNVSGWFAGSSSQIQEISAGSLKIDSQVSQLVQAMATYSANNPGFDPTSPSISGIPNDANLQSSLAAAWHA
jgi:Ca2+-binding RTX toxin-like protein